MLGSTAGNALKAEFIMRGKRVPDVADDLKIKRNTMYRKLRGDAEFTRGEMSAIINYLKLDKQKAFDIFFAQ
jgi:hypothetical protein